MVASVALVAGALVAVPAAGPALAGAPVCLGEAADKAAAVRMAAECGTRVEVLAARTETTQVFANPDGTGVIEQYAQPQRIRKADGTWSAVDTTLVANPDGSISPRAVALDLSISGGGSGPLIHARRTDDEVSLSWSGGRLPKPTIDGSSATYADVYPGVDLVVTALKTGFREVLVVKDRAAAANPALGRLTFGTALRGLRWQEKGGPLVAVDAEGKPVLGASGPRMWDSSATGNASATGGRARSTVDGPAVGARGAAMPATLDNGEIALTPDRDLLTDPSTVFPVYLDPTVVYTSWTMINKNYPAQSYWSYDKTDCPGTYTGECAKVGYSDYANLVTYRSMWQFPTSSFKGKQILGAQFTLDLLYSWECTKSTTELEQISTTLSSSTTWNNTADNWPGTNAATVSNESCDGARVPTEFAITSLISGIAGGSATYVTLGLKAGTETSHAGWKKFDADTARLVVSTNTVPNVPSSLTVDNKACVVGTNRPFTSTATPSLRAYVSDGDGNSLTASFEWARIRYNGTYGPISDPRSQTSVASGSTSLVNLPAGVLDKGDDFVGTGDWDGDGHTDVIVRDPNGVLYLLPGKGTSLTSRFTIGSGWSGYTIAGVGDFDHDGHQDILTRQNSTNELWLYPGQSKRSGSTEARALMGTSWGGWTFAGVADWDRDGHQDLMARDSAGVLWLYPGLGTRGGGFSTRVNIGSGWSSYTYFGTIDWDLDGAPDVIAKDPAGDLWLYVGSGQRAAYSGSPYRYQIGNGWASYSALTMPDFNGDGKADLVAESGGTVWYGYPGSGARSYGGARWTIGSVGISDGAYAFRASASDAHATSADSGWCEFEVDQTNPDPPKVTSDTYHAGSVGCPAEGCGSVGQTGSFTFSAGLSTDVASYKWGFSDPPSTTVSPAQLGGSVTVEWTPSTGGAKTLYVQSVDRAGRFAQTTYQFYVAPPSPALARWRMNEPAGSTTLFDDTGHGYNATLNAGMLGVPGRIVGGETALRLDGTSSATTATPVIADTGRSFSVAAWVKLGDKSIKRNIISQGGTNNSAFVLEYLQSADTWKFTVTSADVGTPTYYGASSAAGAPKVGVWTHLVGTFDSTAGELRLYVNGVLAGTTTGVSTWDANGVTRIGGPSPALWTGELAQVQVWNRVVSATEAAALVDPVADSLVGRWDLEEVGPGPSYDASNYAHDLSFSGGASIPPSGSGHTGTGLRLDGVDDYAATDGPVLNTDQSFTVSAWVRPDRIVGGNMTALGQQGAAQSAFYLGTRRFTVNGVDEYRWSMTLAPADADTGLAWHHATSTQTLSASNIGVWAHLVGVFDANRQEIRLYVNGVLASTTSRPYGWHGGGPMTIGSAVFTPAGDVPRLVDRWDGDLDEVRVYQGVVADVTRIP